MCIAPSYMRNPRYKENKSNKGVIPPLMDDRLGWIQIGCGKCAECRKQRATGWKTRLLEEIKEHRRGQFVTLTMADEAGEKLAEELKTNNSKKIATVAIRRFRERWRKKYGNSCRHFIVTELGHKGKYRAANGKMCESTQRLHFHGIIFESKERFGTMYWRNIHNQKEGRQSDILDEIWQYGQTHVGYCEVNEKMVAYVIKYILKTDEEHEGYYGQILTSPGMGKTYTEKAKKRHRYCGRRTIKKYKMDNGTMVGMPQYYKNKFWTTAQRERLRLIEENKPECWVAGQKYLKEDYLSIIRAREYAQRRHTELKLWGYTKRNYEWRYGKSTEIPILIVKNQAIQPNYNFG